MAIAVITYDPPTKSLACLIPLSPPPLDPPPGKATRRNQEKIMRNAKENCKFIQTQGILKGVLGILPRKKLERESLGSAPSTKVQKTRMGEPW